MVNKNICIRLFIYFNIIRVKISYVDDIIKNIVCPVFYIFILNFITQFIPPTQNFFNLMTRNGNECFCFALYFIR